MRASGHGCAEMVSLPLLPSFAPACQSLATITWACSSSRGTPLPSTRRDGGYFLSGNTGVPNPYLTSDASTRTAWSRTRLPSSTAPTDITQGAATPMATRAPSANSPGSHAAGSVPWLSPGLSSRGESELSRGQPAEAHVASRPAVWPARWAAPQAGRGASGRPGTPAPRCGRPAMAALTTLKKPFCGVPPHHPRAREGERRSKVTCRARGDQDAGGRGVDADRAAYRRDRRRRGDATAGPGAVRSDRTLERARSVGPVPRRSAPSRHRHATLVRTARSRGRAVK